MRTNNANCVHARPGTDDPSTTNRRSKGAGEQQRLTFEEAYEQGEAAIDFWWKAESKASREWRKKAKQIREGKRSSQGIHGQDSQDAKEEVASHAGHLD